MLQVQLLVPSINTDATVTANLKREEELELELKSEIKVMDATSVQKIAMKYGNLIFQLIIFLNITLQFIEWLLTSSIGAYVIFFKIPKPVSQ